MDPTRPIAPEVLVSHAEAIRGLARAIVRDAVEAEDVAQETLRAAVTAGPRPGWDPRSWLLGVARNLARTAARSRARRRERERRAARPEAVPSTLDVVASLSERRAVVEAVLALPEPYRTVVTLRWFEGLPPAEIAARLGVPVETVRTRARRALPMLRQLLAQRHGGDERKGILALLPLTLPGIGGTVVTIKSKAAVLAVVATLLLATSVWIMVGLSRKGDDPPEPQEVTAGAHDTTTPRLEGRARPAGAPTPELVAAPTGRGVHGLVRTEAGAALVAVVRLEDPDRLPGAKGPSIAGPSIATAPDGSFRFEVPAGMPAIVRVTASAAGHRSSALLVRAGDPAPALLRLVPAAALWFRVLDAATDRPVAGAAARVLALAPGGTQEAAATTDADGLVALLDSGPGDPLAVMVPTLEVSHPEHETLRITLWSESRRLGGDRARPTEVYVRRGVAGLARVFAEDGVTPVAGVRVRAFSGASGATGAGATYAVPEDAFAHVGDGTSDAEGLVRLGVPTAKQQLVLVAEAPGRVAVRCLADGGSGATRPWTLILRPALRVRGVVVDESGAPVPGAHVETDWRSWLASKAERLPGDAFVQAFPPAAWFDRVATESDAEGRFTLDWVLFAGGSSRVWAFSPGPAIASADVTLPAAGTEVPEVRIVLSMSQTAWTVTVRDEAGQPIHGAIVGRPRSYPMARTDAHGVARVEARAAPGEPVIVFASAPGRATTSVVVDTSSSEHALELVLGPARTLTVRTVDADGNPRAVNVEVYAAEGAPTAPEPPGAPFDPRRLAQGTTDADGFWRADALPRGPLVVWARRNMGMAGAARVEVSEGDEAVVRLPVSLPDPSAGFVVEGSFLAADGEPILRYRASMEGTGGGFTPTLEGRRFRFENIPPGRYDLLVTTDADHRRHIREVEVGPGVEVRDVVIRASDDASLAGAVRAPPGVRVEGMRINATAVGTRRAWGTSTWLKEDGSFLLANLMPGRYAIRLYAEGPRPQAIVQLTDADVELVRGARLERTFTAVAAARLWLSTDDARFAEARVEAPVALYTQASDWTAIQLTDASGGRQSSGGLYRTRTATPFLLLPGRYHLLVSHPTFGTEGRDIDVSGTGDIDLVVRLQPPAPR